MAQSFVFDMPVAASDQGLILTHGAGANCESALLVAVATIFASAGFTVLRYNLPFRQKRPFGPPHPSQAAEDRNGLRAAVAELRGKVSGRIVLGGHSYGGRQASILASEDQAVCDALLLLSYPLHPPNKPEQLRTAHFGQLRTPAHFVHGTNDPFGTIAEMQAALELIPAPKKLAIVEKAGHDLFRGKLDAAIFHGV
jgi:uncharacterized protein